jgi:hypothetical protein
VRWREKRGSKKQKGTRLFVIPFWECGLTHSDSGAQRFDVAVGTSFEEYENSADVVYNEKTKVRITKKAERGSSEVQSGRAFDSGEGSKIVISLNSRREASLNLLIAGDDVTVALQILYRVSHSYDFLTCEYQSKEASVFYRTSNVRGSKHSEHFLLPMGSLISEVHVYMPCMVDVRRESNNGKQPPISRM